MALEAVLALLEQLEVVEVAVGERHLSQMGPSRSSTQSELLLAPLEL